MSYAKKKTNDIKDKEKFSLKGCDLKWLGSW